jgi:phage host-nuclease inhibitor protein Gam
MGRIKTPERKKIGSIEELNEALRRINECKSYVGKKQHEYNEEDAKRRKALDDACNPYNAEIEALEIGMEDYCNLNREQVFGDKKSYELANGIVSFRTTTPAVEKDKGLTWPKILDIIRNSKFVARYVRTKEEINKEQILADWGASKDKDEKEKLAADLRAIYLKVVQSETFGYSLNQAAATEA